ncbi:hypothetical protein OF83DRAFT_1177751 [Amylostereum chailletii]|nr:hypothetical protein OF83DRAFT_1177751 [Amylostereum chailletii]
MSADFEAALRAGSDIVRVGTGVFGSRRLKGETLFDGVRLCSGTASDDCSQN